MTEENNNQELAKEIITEGFSNEKTDDEMKEAMIIQGIPYGIMNKLFKTTVETLGFRISPKVRSEQTATFLEGYVPDTADVDSHLAMISALEDHLGCKTTQAGASMRKWAKENKYELPKAQKTPTVAPGFRGNTKIIADWALENQDCTFEELIAYAAENIPVTKSGKNASRSIAVNVWNAMIFAKAWNVEVKTETEEDEMAA